VSPPLASEGPADRRPGTVNGRHAAAFILSAFVCACGGGGSENVPYDLAEYVSVARQIVATDVIIPTSAGDLALGRGWDLNAPADALARGIWIGGTIASFSFEALGTGPLWLRWEARGLPPADDSAQRVTAFVNQVPIGSAELPDRWTEGSLEIPQRALREGGNRIELRLSGARRPAGLPAETRALAARFRFLQIARSPEATPWANRPDSIALAATRIPESPAIVMPNDSLLELLVELPQGGQLQGNVTANEGRPNDRLAIEVRIDAGDGRGRIVGAEDLPPAGTRRRPVDWSLPAGIYRLRLAVNGTGSRTVRWEDLRIESEAPPPPAALPRPIRPVHDPLPGTTSVIIILLDAARADAFSAVAGTRPTPAFAQLASEGTVFTDATSNAPWTGPSVAAMLTGRFPDASGVQTWDGRLPESIPTLFELAQAAGYRTLVWSQHTVYQGNRTLRRGLDDHVLNASTEPEALPEASYLFADSRPVLALVHLLPPHGPYTPPAPFRGRYSGWWSGDLPAISASYLNRIVAEGQPPLAPDYVRYVRDRYDDNVAYADSLVGEIIERIRSAGRLDDTLVMMLSDHGEAFYEHGMFKHTQQVYRESLHIPMVIRWPSGSVGWRKEVDAPVSLVDVLPTLAEALGFNAPWNRLQGRSLLGLARGESTPVRPLLASTMRVTRHYEEMRPLARLRLGNEVLVHDAFNGTTELYDLSADALQQSDLAGENPLRAAFLTQQLRLLQSRSRLSLLAESPAGAPLELDPAVIEELRALGYIQ